MLFRYGKGHRRVRVRGCWLEVEGYWLEVEGDGGGCWLDIMGEDIGGCELEVIDRGCWLEVKEDIGGYRLEVEEDRWG